MSWWGRWRRAPLKRKERSFRGSRRGCYREWREKENRSVSSATINHRWAFTVIIILHFFSLVSQNLCISLFWFVFQLKKLRKDTKSKKNRRTEEKSTTRGRSAASTKAQPGERSKRNLRLLKDMKALQASLRTWNSLQYIHNICIAVFGAVLLTLCISSKLKSLPTENTTHSRRTQYFSSYLWYYHLFVVSSSIFWFLTWWYK